jgi:hypothetical protein
MQDSINLTAALINPPGTLTGDVNATGCNIGVYYTSGTFTVDHADIYGANYYGIVNNGANVDIEKSTVSDIGDTPIDGAEHGVAIYFLTGSSSKGSIIGNYIWSYQKAGIVVNGNAASTTISENTVIGIGPRDFIAQNGIQVGFGATAQVEANVVKGNAYTGSGDFTAGGIVLVGGACYAAGAPATTNVEVDQNLLAQNDIGIWFSNLDGSCNTLTTPTKDVASDNRVVNNELTNVGGNGASQGYQAGILDQGDKDKIVGNSICGLGYLAPGTAATVAIGVDLSEAINPTHDNTVCPIVDDTGPVAASAPAAPKLGAARRRLVVDLVP